MLIGDVPYGCFISKLFAFLDSGSNGLLNCIEKWYYLVTLEFIKHKRYYWPLAVVNSLNLFLLLKCSECLSTFVGIDFSDKVSFITYRKQQFIIESSRMDSRTHTFHL